MSSEWIKFVKETQDGYGISYKEAMGVAKLFWPQVKKERGLVKSVHNLKLKGVPSHTGRYIRFDNETESRPKSPVKRGRGRPKSRSLKLKGVAKHVGKYKRFD